ncbi:MAG: hypothetical protein N4A33_06895 [Bacteriovoracaceae bacterium]|jgi:uncharacterized membrane protein SirB2|nr:hypothetical protein [Bacteriovoracaceae bacterium]
MSYHDLKLIHICSVIVYLLSVTVSIYNPSKKFHKILSGILSLIIIISGIAILGRWNISHTGPFPSWVIVKMAIWTSLTLITPIIIKRFPSKAKLLFWPWTITAAVATAMAIYKPL